MRPQGNGKQRYIWPYKLLSFNQAAVTEPRSMRPKLGL